MERKMKRIKGVKYRVTGDQALGGEQYAVDTSWNFTLEKYIMLLTNVTPNKFNFKKLSQLSGLKQCTLNNAMFISYGFCGLVF